MQREGGYICLCPPGVTGMYVANKASAIVVYTLADYDVSLRAETHSVMLVVCKRDF